MTNAVVILLSFALAIAVAVAIFESASEARGHREHLKRCAHLGRLRDDYIAEHGYEDGFDYAAAERLVGCLPRKIASSPKGASGGAA